MDHELSESQRLLKRSAAEFFAQQYPLDRLRELQGDRTTRDPELWSALVLLGWTAAPFPEQIGGVAGSLLEAAPLLEEMGRAAYPSPYVHSCVAGGLGLGDSAHDGALVAAIASGDATVIWSPHTGLTPPVRREGGRLQGRVLGVAWPELATHFLVPTREGVALVEAADDGVSRRNLDSSGAESVGEVVFAGAAVEAMVPASVGEYVILAGASGTALMLLGAGERALELAVEYARQRVQFGQPIGAFQALQHKCANMLIEMEVARGLAYKAAATHGTDAFPRLARYAKSFAGDASRRVTRDAIQIHGGVGFIDNHKVQLPYRLAGSLNAAYRTAHEHRAVVAAGLLATGMV